MLEGETASGETALSDVQRVVVEAPIGRLVFLGSAGAGKSLVVAERAARLIREGLARPEQVLVLAPSRRAALALAERVRELTGRSPTATPFHGLALAILRRHYREMGYTRPPELLTTARHFHLLRALLAAEDPARWPHHRGLLASSALRKLAYDFVMGASENGLDAAELRTRVTAWGRPDLLDLAEFVGRYRSGTGDTLDYGELLAKVADLLATRPEIAATHRRAYRHILVDEFEEASFVQAELLRLLVGEATDLLVAGDPQAAISSYRGASPSHLLNLAGRLGARVVVSNENHRSAARVAGLARAARPVRDDIMSSEGGVSGLASRGADPSAEPGYAVLRSFTYQADEARWVAAEIASLVRAGTLASELAVLFRSLDSPLARLTMAELRRLGVPHRVQASHGVLADPLVQGAIDLLRYLLATGKPGAGPADRLDAAQPAGTSDADPGGGAPFALAGPQPATSGSVPPDPTVADAFLRFLDSPLAGLPPFGLAELRRAVVLAGRDLASLEAGGLEGLALSDGTREALTGLLSLIAGLRPKAAWSAASLLWELWRAFPAFRDDALAGGPSSAAFATLLDEASSLGRRRFLGLPELMALVDAGYFEQVGASSPEARGVVLTTVHQARGREWKVVFVPGLVEGSFPLRLQPLDVYQLFSPDLPGDPDPDPAKAAARLAALREASHAAEEARVFYVALSRARRAVYLSYSVRSADGDSAELPSRFLEAVRACPEVEVVPADDRGDEKPPDDVELSVAHYRRLLASDDALLRSQGLYALSELRQRWPEAVRPAEWWENVGETTGALPLFPDGKLYLSASRLGTYRDCPLGYQFGYLWRLGEPEGPALTIGSILHAVLEEYHAPDSRLARTREALQTALERRFDPAAFRYRPVAAQAKRTLEGLLDLYYNRYGTSDAAIAVERRFRFAFGPHTVTGFIDRIDRLPDGTLELLDYKTGQAMAKADAQSDLQLALYDLAFHEDDDLKALGAPAKVSYLYLKCIGPRADGKRSYAPTDESRSHLREVVACYADAMLAERFPPHRLIPVELPDLDPAELERARKQNPCRFCGFGWVCPEMEREIADE